MSDTKQTLLLDILTQGDDKILKLIAKNPDAMKALLDTYGDSPGMLWEELVMRFEWTFDLKSFKDNMESVEVRAVIEEAEKNYKYEFTMEMIKNWSSNIGPDDHEEGLGNSFFKYISSRE